MSGGKLVLEKSALRELAKSNVDDQLNHVLLRILHKSRKEKGWCGSVESVDKFERMETVKAEDGTESQVEKVVYKATFAVSCTPKRKRQPEVIKKDFEHIVRIAGNAGRGKGWNVVESVETPDEVVLPDSVAVPEAVVA
jgi:hypothetical protein